MDKCALCGRKLKKEKSRELGYGPVCYKKRYGNCLRARCKKENSFIGGSLNSGLPGQMSIDDYPQLFSAE